MRICHVSNMANDGWASVKGLRAIGCNAELILYRPAHVASLPQWEEAEIDLDKLGTDLHNPNWDVLNENWTMPDYVHVWDLRRSWHPLSRTLRWSVRLVRLGEYDMVIGHVPFAAIAPFYRGLWHRPYIVYDAGWIRFLHSDPSYRLGRIGYRNATKIFFTNVDTYSMFLANGYAPDKLVYTPFAIDTGLYAPRPISSSLKRESFSPVFFSPTRQSWLEKGNDRLLYAFHRYLKRQPNALLLLAEWGHVPEQHPDSCVAKAKRLIDELEIAGNVEWLPVMHKNLLIQYYNAADIVFDQFLLGAFGTTAPEAMSCERPVVGYAEPDMWIRQHGSIPPVANARTAEDIYERMVELESTSLRRQYGRRGRKWVLETCEMTLVARRQLEVCQQVIER